MILSNPLFLIALAAVALPIVVHLFNFRRYKKVYFSNVEYLEELQMETKRQSRLREYLILAARILAIVFLVLAFAQPVIPNKHNPLKAGGSAVSVYVDNSFSMENTGSDGSLLEQAKRKAREIAAAYQPNDQFQLITNDVEGSHFRWLSREEFLSAVDDIEPSPASPTLADMAAKQIDFLHSSTAHNRFAYQLSDFQQSAADMADFPQDSLIFMTLVPLKSLGVDNLSLDSVWFDTPVALQGSAMTAQVLVTNHGDRELADLPVKLYVDGNERSIGSVTLPAHASQAVPLSFTVDHSGVLHCRAEIADYPITFDDRIYFSLNVMDRVPMLCVEGRPQPFVQRLFEGDSLVDFHSCSDRNIDFTRLSEHQFILLGELASIPSGLAQALATQVEQGASLLIVPAEDADVQSYNSLLQQLQAPQLGAYKKETARVSEVDAQSSLYRGVFAGNHLDPSQMELPTTQGHFKAQSASTTVAEAAIRYPTGDLFLSVTPYGSGSVYLLTTPLRTDVSDFPQQALFVPTLFNMALFARPIGQIYTTIDNVSPVLLPVRMQVEEGASHLTNLDGSFDLIPDLRIQGGRTWLYPHNQIREAGNYLIDSLVGLSFNYSGRESQMQFLSAGEVQKAVKDHHLDHTAVVRNAQKPLDQAIRAQHDAHPLWRWCVLLCLLCLAFEIALIRLPRRSKS